jgi:two-component system, chemotaxis family, protein-glutamate methylesterase/glutaminase
VGAEAALPDALGQAGLADIIACQLPARRILCLVSGRRHSEAFDIVVVVGSQGALPVARAVLSGLPEDFPAPVVYVQHRAADPRSMLAGLLDYHTRLPVRDVQDGEPVTAGVVHVPPAGHETTIAGDGTFRVADGPCAADPLMASAADVYGSRVLGLVLSGRLRDGAEGLRRIKQAGGRGLVQAPETAEADSMPLAAMATGCYDFALPPAQLRDALVALVAVPGAADLLAVRPHPVTAVAAFSPSQL